MRKSIVSPTATTTTPIADTWRDLERIARVEITSEDAAFPIEHALCIHRVGSLGLGDMAVWVGVSSAHRGEAFEACRFIIDEVKHRVPIWKKEHYRSGDSGWVNCERCAAPTQRAHAEHHHDRHAVPNSK